LFSITGGDDLSLFEVNQVATLIRERVSPNANVVFGAIINPAMEDLCVRMIVIGNKIDWTGDNDSSVKFINVDGKNQLPTRALKVFLCHSSADKPVVRKLYQRLYAKQGIDPWLDEAKLLPGEKWDLEITKAVKESDVVIVCISKDSVSKEGYVQKEMKHALDIANEKPDDTIFIVPLRLEECKVPERLIQWHWLNYFEEGAFDKLMDSLRKRAQTLGLKIE
jgi:hypothetical protein